MELRKWIGVAVLFVLAGQGWAGDRSGALVLSFDDGYPSWIKTIAPELARVGGVASCFVNNQRIHNGDISFEDLRVLQGRYGWEVGTHTYHHYNAVDFVKRKGLEAWVTDELDRSIIELEAQGLKVHSLVFPFNAVDGILSERVKTKVASFRRWEEFPLTDGRRADGSIPGKSIDLAGYIPLEQLYQWIDFTQAQKKKLFLYGHEVLPDERFIEGLVASVGSDTVTAVEEIALTMKEGLCLAPDKNQKLTGLPLRVGQVNGKEIKVLLPNLARQVKPGSTFILGPCYGTPLSFFRKFIDYSAARLRFLTVQDALSSGTSP